MPRGRVARRTLLFCRYKAAVVSSRSTTHRAATMTGYPVTVCLAQVVVFVTLIITVIQCQKLTYDMNGGFDRAAGKHMKAEILDIVKGVRSRYLWYL